MDLGQGVLRPAGEDPLQLPDRLELIVRHADVDAEDASLEALLDPAVLERAGVVAEDEVRGLDAGEVAFHGRPIPPPFLGLEDRAATDQEFRFPTRRFAGRRSPTLASAPDRTCAENATEPPAS